MTSLTPCLWYNAAAEEAVRFYAAPSPNTSVDAVQLAPGDYPAGREGDVLTVKFPLLGAKFAAMNGSPQFLSTEAISFQVHTADQAETDHYRSAIIENWSAVVENDGSESQCGWCKDHWGLSREIVPRPFGEALSDPDPAAAERAFEAMITLGHIDVAAIEAARAGRPAA